MRTRLPSMHELMDDPIYRAYMRKPPPAMHQLSYGHPWRLWVNNDGKWLTREYASYREVWPVFVGRFRAGDQDPTIVSKRVFYAPPGEWYRVRVKRPRRPTPDNKATTKIVIEERWRQLFFWDGTDLQWCGRCRRPTLWAQLPSSHHAMRKQPCMATEGNLERCIICGIRWESTPLIGQMERW